MSCPSCLGLLRFPVNLGCGHSMCKVCILNGDEAERDRFLRLENVSLHSSVPSRSASTAGVKSVRITCRICHALSTFTSESALIVDTELQSMVDVLQGVTAAAEACMRCNRAEATTSCAECNAKMCDACCDLVHEGSLRSHQIANCNVGSLDPSLHPRPCDVSGHHHYKKELFCVDCRTFLCVLCAQQLVAHKNHNVVTATEAAAVERKRLIESVNAAESFRAELRQTVAQIDAVADATAHHANEEIRVFEETINALISTLTKRRDELTSQAKAMCEVEVNALRASRERIFSLATRLNESVAEGNKALRHKSAIAIISRAAEMEDAITRWDPIIVPSASCPAFDFPHFKEVLGLIARISVAPAAITAIEAGLDANHLGRTLQFLGERAHVVGSNVPPRQGVLRVGDGRPPLAAHSRQQFHAGGGSFQSVNTTTSSSLGFVDESSNARSLLNEFDSPTADRLTRPPPPPPSSSAGHSNTIEQQREQHFFLTTERRGNEAPSSRFANNNAVAPRSEPLSSSFSVGRGGGFGGSFISAALVAEDRENANHPSTSAQLIDQSLAMRSPRTNLTDPSGGVLIDPSVLLPKSRISGRVGIASAQHTRQPFKFVKSTFGDLQFLNAGRTVASFPVDQKMSDSEKVTREVLGWETAMCDALLTGGRHYFELHLDRYARQSTTTVGGLRNGRSAGGNGHNVIVGVVFDGNYGLCDAIGEDNNSVGLDLGAGAKCVGGDFSLPYMREGLVREGDVIGVDIDFEKQTLSFYHNGKYLGVAFSGLCRPCYPAVSLLEDQQVTLMFPMQRPL